LTGEFSAAAFWFDSRRERDSRCGRPTLPLRAPDPAPDPTVSPEQAHWFAEQVHPHETALRGYLRHQFPSVDADDVVQESYLKLLRARAAGQITSAKAYVFAIARHTALTLFHRRRQLYSEVPVNELPGWRVLDGGPDAAEATNARQRLALVADAVDALPPRCREIMHLALVDGLGAIAIAEKLALSENTVRVQLARGIRKCAEYLRARGEVP
jgi:RNA polymerase sigma-70 factor (ECF subfamily)